MSFVDEARIFVKAGDGGRGCVSFRREKFVPRGGPDGGDGGKGGDVVVRATAGKRTLLDLKYRQHHMARPGGNGEGSHRTGRNSADVVIPVPAGTIVRNDVTGEIIADLRVDGDAVIVARGGRGGKGNAHFTTATNQAPRHAQPGEAGQEGRIALELKLLADVGIVGLPNAGKSTLLSRVTAARPKIAPYPFTTLTPHLGVVDTGESGSFVLADIPGLIAGAHDGAGMGIRFLRHIERTSVLLHLIDIAREPGGMAWEDFTTVNGELAAHGSALMEKPQVVVFGKSDLPAVRERLPEETERFARRGVSVLACSAATGEGIPGVIRHIFRILNGQEKTSP